MKEYPYPYPWRDLPGRKDEMLYLEKRFTEMSVLEQCQMEGIGQVEHIGTAADLINLTAQLYNYPFNAGATDAETLGHYVAEFRTKANPKQYPYLNFKQIGADYHEKVCGVFTENGYVEIGGECRECYNGDDLANLDNTCIRIKLASKDCPNGVWLRLPDARINNDEPHEFDVALSALKVTNWSHATVLETRCCFENLQNLAEQYDSMDRFINDANNFGYVWEEAGQGQCCYHEHWQAAMELEGCTRLDYAIDIAENLHCYDFIPCEEHWEKFGRSLAKENNLINDRSALSRYFDYAAYAAAELERLNLTPRAHGFIRRNEQDFCYEYSTPPSEEQGMEMGQ